MASPSRPPPPRPLLRPLAAVAAAAAVVAAGCAGSRPRAGPVERAARGAGDVGPLSAASSPAPPGAPIAPAPIPAAPAPPGPLLARARALRAAGDPAGARALLATALRGAPADPAVRMELASLLVDGAIQLDWAGALLAGLPEATPGRWLLLARLDELRGDDGAAVVDLDRQLAHGDEPGLRLRRAHLLARLGRAGEALAEVERARELAPADVAVRSELADRYEAAGRFAEAEAELRGLAEARPPRRERWLRLAEFYRRRGDPVRAGEAIARAGTATADSGPRPRRILRPLLPSSR